jgi:hypothetical protein
MYFSAQFTNKFTFFWDTQNYYFIKFMLFYYMLLLFIMFFM